jgi:hypothetical protein
MGEHDQVRDGGENQTQGRKDNAAQPLGEATGNVTPERYPSVRKDDSIEVGGEGRSFVGEGAAKPGARERSDEVDPAVSHGGAESDTDDPDAR